VSDYRTTAELRTTLPALSHHYQCFGSQVPENIKVGVHVSLIRSGDKFSGFKCNLTT
jgi:hypothetical protein